MDGPPPSDDGEQPSEENPAGHRDGYDGGWTAGGGIFCGIGSRPTIINCVVRDCYIIGGNAGSGAGAEEEYPNGLTEVDGVPVMDVLGATIKMAETLVTLKQAGSCWISRKAFYAQATPKAIELAQPLLKYDGPGFWDYEL